MKLISLLFATFLIVFGDSLYSQTTVYQSSINQNLTSPIRMAIDNNDNIYVTDNYQKCIIKYDINGNFIVRIFVEENPVSIAINQNNEIFIGDGNTGNIFKITPSGSQSLFYSGLSLPNSMTFSPSGLLYVSDGELHQIFVFDVSGNLQQTFGQGTLIFPTCVVYDQTNSRILVSEHGGIGTGFSPTCKIWIFDLSGTLQGSFASNGNADGQFYRIQGMTMGKCGNLFVCDPFQGDISVFDKNNIFISRFGQFGEQPGQLNVPMDILFDSNDRVIIASMNNGKLEVFNITDTLPTSKIINSNATICNGTTTDIQIDFTGTPPWTFTYTIDGVAQTPITTNDNPYILTVSTAGLYEISALSDATTTGTCFTGSALIDVSSTTPTANIPTGNITICDNETGNIPIDFTGTPPWTFTYTVDGQNPTTIITANNPYELGTNTAGMYEVTSISDAGCIGSSSGYADLTVIPVPTSTISSNNLDLCQGETTTLSINFTGTSPWTFTYSANGQDTVINTTDSIYDILTSDAGTYSVLSVSDATCSNSQNQSEVQVVVNTLPTAAIDNITSVVCDGETAVIPVTLSGNAPWSLTYTVDDSLYTTTLNNIYGNPYNLYVTQGGTYTISQVSDVNCAGTVYPSSADIIVLPSSIPDFTFSQNGLEVSFTNNSLNSTSYLWDFGDGDTSTTIHPVHIYQTSGIYQVNLTATNVQCGDNVFGQTVDLFVNVESLSSENLVKFYPNPSNGLITMEISIPATSDIYVNITSVNGQIIYNNKFENTGKIVAQIDLSLFSSGLYTVRIISDKFTKTSKLVLYK